MKTSQSFRVYFTIKNDKETDGKAPLYACVTVNKEKCFIALKQNIEVSIWDFGKGAAKGTKNESKELNAYLDDVRLVLGNHYKDLQLKGKMITVKSIKSLYLGEKDEVYTLTTLFGYHNETAKEELNPETLKHYFVTQRYLIKFLEEKYNSTDIYLHQLDFRFIKDFEVYLRNHKPKGHQKPLKNNGVMKHMVMLKKMVHLSLNLRWIDIDPFVAYKIKIHKVNREQLSELELNKIEIKNFTVGRLDMVRDMFVFSCYTGLCYVDMINLTPVNIVLGSDGEKWIRTFREKTSIPVNVPLLPKAIKILKKYENNERSLADGRIFPVISNQKVNSYLKEIADVCDIAKNITFHIARHTCATTVMLTNGVPIETVSKLLGHSKIATTQIYARVIENKIKEDMKALQQKLLTRSLPVLDDHNKE
ncbi:MAG TPA: integrase [Mucilaginibacter sp.]|nr:integrase [Mucilaginibacter sp.]